jgi:hypothetical protein
VVVPPAPAGARCLVRNTIRLGPTAASHPSARKSPAAALGWDPYLGGSPGIHAYCTSRAGLHPPLADIRLPAANPGLRIQALLRPGHRLPAIPVRGLWHKARLLIQVPESVTLEFVGAAALAARHEPDAPCLGSPWPARRGFVVGRRVPAAGHGVGPAGVTALGRCAAQPVGAEKRVTASDHCLRGSRPRSHYSPPPQHDRSPWLFDSLALAPC